MPCETSFIRWEQIYGPGKALGPVNHLCQVFEKQTSHYKRSNYHPVPVFGKDLDNILKVLENEKVFTLIPG